MAKTQKERYIDKVSSITTDLKDKAEKIVELSKKTSAVDTGRLKRSINFVINLQGKFVFTEVFYGQFGDNSDLEENIKKYWPKNEPYDLVWTDDNGNPYETVRKLGSGRTTRQVKLDDKKADQISRAFERYKIGGIKDFLKNLAKKNEAALKNLADGEAKNEGTDKQR